MNKYVKIISIFLVVLILMLVVSKCCYAGDLGLGDLDDYKTDDIGSDKLEKYAGTILGVLQIVGVIVSVVMLVSIGLKFMFASVEEKADYKKSMIPYLVGAFLVFTGTTIPNLIYKLIQGL